jgi:hypothetical protein
VKINILILAIVVVSACAIEAKADPLTFSDVSALQNNGTTVVDLFSSPGVTLTGPQITFRVAINGVLPPGATDTLLVSYRDDAGGSMDQMIQIPLFGTIQPPFTLVFSTLSPNIPFQGLNARLSIDLLSSSPDFIIPSGPDAGQRVNSFTYTFKVAQPVPEPASVALLWGGLSGLILRRRILRRQRRKS